MLRAPWLGGALSALPDFRRAVRSDTAPGGRLQARSKKWSKKVEIKSISPTVSAKFPQVPGAQGKGVSWGTRGDASDARMRRWGTRGAEPGATRESEEARQQLGGWRAGVEPARSGKAFRGWGVDAGSRGEGRTGRLREGGSTRRRWNYNLVEERGAGSESIHSAPTSGADSPQLSPSSWVT